LCRSGRQRLAGLERGKGGTGEAVKVEEVKDDETKKKILKVGEYMILKNGEERQKETASVRRRA